MTFSRWVFRIAGIWGLLTVAPMYFLYDAIGRGNPPPFNHPEIYYGFLGVTLAWQIAFLIIARDPARFRPLMIAAMVEKFSFVIAMAVLYAQERVTLNQLAFSMTDLALGILFVAAFVKTPRR